jgi:hypothetical protein
MKVALIEPYQSGSNPGENTKKGEPAHLVGMYNLILETGIEAEIIDAYSNGLTEEELGDTILRQGFTHAAFTTYSYDRSISYLSRVASMLQGKAVIILGGMGSTYTPTLMQRAISPDFIIGGAGELTLQWLVQCNFHLDVLPQSFSLSTINGCPMLCAPPMPLSDIPFARPYSFDLYNHIAAPRLQKGCAGSCVFCSGAYMNDVEYVSAEAAQQVIHYLVSAKKASHISPLGPDFTAEPQRANLIIKSILDAAIPIQELHLSVRLDTLFDAVKEAPDVWRELCYKTAVSFESSIESFSPARLNRLGKNVTPSFISNIFNRLEEIIDITNCRMAISRIALDPLVTMDDFLLDNRSFIRLLETFPDNVTIAAQVINRYVRLWGIPAVKEAGSRDNPWADANVFLDSAIGLLERTLLIDEHFRLWCTIAEQIADFRKRNVVINEILRTVCDVGAKM